jgi:site-specific recombinase XerD
MSSPSLLPFQPMSMTTAQLAAVSFLARYAGRTHDLYAYQLRRWFGWCEGNGLDPLLGIQRAHVELYVRGLGEAGLMASSTNTMMHGVRGFFRFAHIDGVIPADPAVYARLPKVQSDESRTHGLDRLELIRFLQVAQTITVHHGALAYLLGINALRASEAAAVRVEDYAQTMRGQRVLHLVGKGDKPAPMPLTVPVLRVLEASRGDRITGPLILRPTSGKPIDRRDAYRMVARVAKAAGIPRHNQPPLVAPRGDHQRARRRRATTRRADPRPSRRPENHRALRPRPRQPRPTRRPLPHRLRRRRVADRAAGGVNSAQVAACRWTHVVPPRPSA